MANNEPDQSHDLKPKLLVIGVGGAGCNAVDNMIRSNLQGVDFISANTDAQALTESLADRRIQLGPDETKGLGAGSQVITGKKAAEESIDEIRDLITGHNMIFITAGMGGGTGTGASPIIAQVARELGILTLGVVTKPFGFEGPQRMRIASEGISELEKYVDTMIVIPNQNLFLIADHKTSFLEAFNLADDVLYSAVRGVTDLIVMPGLVNLDFADIKMIMQETGNAMMGTGEAEGEDRALKAAEDAIKNPLLESSSVVGAQGLLINITGGNDLMLHEVDDVSNRISQEVGENCFTIFGSALDSKLDGKIRVYVVATGMPDMEPGKTPASPMSRPRFKPPQQPPEPIEAPDADALITEEPDAQTAVTENSAGEAKGPKAPESPEAPEVTETPELPEPEVADSSTNSIDASSGGIDDMP